MLLEQRIEADSGDTAICVFRRSDDAYHFRIDRLRPPDDECDAYWIDGYPLSGIYGSVEEAVSAARATPEWRITQNEE